jgi:hypothetical protein
MSGWWHRVEHWLHWQRGHPEVVNIDGRYWVGFQCATCGAVTGMEECPEWLQDASSAGESQKLIR